MATLHSSASIPIHWRPNCFATAVVVPVPTNGSRTTPSVGENNRITRRASSSGNSASCRRLRDTERIFQTPREPPFRPFRISQTVTIIFSDARRPKHIDVFKLIYSPVGIGVPSTVRPTRVLMPYALIVQIETSIFCPFRNHTTSQQYLCAVRVFSAPDVVSFQATLDSLLATPQHSC